MTALVVVAAVVLTLVVYLALVELDRLADRRAARRRNMAHPYRWDR